MRFSGLDDGWMVDGYGWWLEGEMIVWLVVKWWLIMVRMVSVDDAWWVRVVSVVAVAPSAPSEVGRLRNLVVYSQ